MQISPGTTRFFSSIYLPHLLHLSPCSYGLQLVTQSYPQMQPYMRFLYVRPEVCPRVSRFPESGFLQIPSHDEHPCLRLCPSHYRADSGLAPARNVRRRAHVTTTSSTGGLHWALIRADYCFRQKAGCCKRVTGPLQSGTIFFFPRFVTLLFNVLLYRRFCDITNGLHIVPSCPKRFVPFALQFRVSVINHQCALPFQISHEV